MGDSWRIGVDPGERTELVTAGPFAVVRNPIFAAMIPTALGLALLVPSVIAIAGFAALVGALELQVRVVEEPYLAARPRRRLWRLRGPGRALRPGHRTPRSGLSSHGGHDPSGRFG